MINIRWSLLLLRSLLEVHPCHATEENVEILRKAMEELEGYYDLPKL